jgi:hypothetical protein
MRKSHSGFILSLTNTLFAALPNTPSPPLIALPRHISTLPNFRRSMDDMSVYPLYCTYMLLAKTTKYAAEPDLVAVTTHAPRAPQQNLCIRVQRYN